MKIKKVEASAINLPLIKPYKSAYGVVERLGNVLVKIHTDDGTIGVGEAAPRLEYGGEFQEGVVLLVGKISPLIIGGNPFDIEKLHETMDAFIAGNSATKASIDVALYDIMGKAKGLPTYMLMGGLCKESIPKCQSVSMDASTNMAREAKRLVEEEGIAVLEVKVGSGPDRDVETIKAIREAVGADIDIIADANQSWSAKTAIKTIKRMERYEVIVEQPTADIDMMALVTKSVDVPILADESVCTPQDAINIVSRGAADMIKINLMRVGGICKAKKIISVAEAAGITCRIGERLVGKITNTAAMQLAVSTKNEKYSAVLQHQRLSLDVVRSGGIVVGKDEVRLGDAPGLGLEIDENILP